MRSRLLSGVGWIKTLEEPEVWWIEKKNAGMARGIGKIV